MRELAAGADQGTMDVLLAVAPPAHAAGSGPCCGTKAGRGKWTPASPSLDRIPASIRRAANPVVDGGYCGEYPWCLGAPP